jgi:transposase
LGIAIYIQISSARRTAKILSELHPVSKYSVHRWIKRFEEKLSISPEKKPRSQKLSDYKVLISKKCLSTAKTSRNLWWIRLPGWFSLESLGLEY